MGMTESQLSTEEKIESLWELGGLKPSQLGRRVWHDIMTDDIFGRASELAYNFVLSVFPLLLFLLSVLGVLATRGTQLRQTLFNGLASVLPPQAWDLVSKTITEVTKNSGAGKLTVGIVFFLWSASSGVSAMISALHMAYKIRNSRPYWKNKGLAILLTMAMSVLVIAALAVVLFGGNLAEFVGSHLGLGNVALDAWKVLQWIAALFFVSFAFALIYYYGPDVRERHWYWITPGSVLGVLLWLAVSYALRAYLHFFNNYSRTYGSLGAVIILLLWFYVTGLAFIAGGEINAEIEHAAAERGHPEAKEKGEKAA
jgi:membrane protein